MCVRSPQTWAFTWLQRRACSNPARARRSEYNASRHRRVRPDGVAMVSNVPASSGGSRRRQGAVLLRLSAAMVGLVACAMATALQAQPAYSAAYISETVPSFIEFQTPASVSVTMQNTG